MIPILLACGLTILTETPFLALWGYRGWRGTAVIVCANAFTNLLLNLCFLLGLPRTVFWIAVGEAAVVLAEYGIFARVFGRSRRLLLLTFLANCLSFGLGLLLFPR